MQPELQNVPCKQLMHMSSHIMSDKMEWNLYFVEQIT